MEDRRLNVVRNCASSSSLEVAGSLRYWEWIRVSKADYLREVRSSACGSFASALAALECNKLFLPPAHPWVCY